MRRRRRRKEYKGGGLHRGKGLLRAVKRGRDERARPEGDLKLKLPRFRLDEFISLAGKIARVISPPSERFPPPKSFSLNKIEIFWFCEMWICFIH